MSVRVSVQPLQILGVRFWLLLPTVGLGFWLIGSLLTQRALQQTVDSIQQLQATLPADIQEQDIRLIKARVDRTQGKTQVKVKPVDLAVRGQEIELSTTRLDQVETLIAQELGISPATVQRLTHYTIHEPVKAQLESSVD
ncbi:hypothetical protein IQ273_11580 [Nodosilinea sp. LEGE 07298]|uniref:hypothetical protein n=1 Tax=Nodosilinea sp. LEGE 07298 TaxID=2777970 RepID=UPI0018813A25|nr:hypothetical protein [Nodosilinea sp. LEGE 07298]MBE9110049.1 hypothetical protein [Nodosilinea sp. LEGE 07298]